MNVFGLALPDFAEKAIYAIGVFLLALFVYNAGSNSTEAKWQAKWNAHLEEQEKINEAVEQSRKNTMRLVRDNAQEIVSDAKEKLADQAVAVTNARADADRLRNEIGKLRAELSRVGIIAGTATGGSSDTSAVILLADLYGSCVANRQELAAAFDEAYTRGMTCQTSYDSARSLLFQAAVPKDSPR